MKSAKKKANKKKTDDWGSDDEGASKNDFLDLKASEDEEDDVPVQNISQKSKKNKKSKKQKSESEEELSEIEDEDKSPISEKVDEITEKLDEAQLDEETPAQKEKRVTNKELKKMKKREDFEKEQEAMLKKGGQGHSELDANFTMSQVHKTGGQKAAMEHAVDIKVENFTISAKGNDLFVNANLLIANGRRYGLVGPNGHGKTTLCK